MNEDTTQPAAQSNTPTRQSAEQQLESSSNEIATGGIGSDSNSNSNANITTTTATTTNPNHGGNNSNINHPNSSTGGSSSSSGSAGIGLTNKELENSKFSKMYEEAWQRAVECDPQEFIEERDLPQPRGGDFSFRAVYGSDDDQDDR